MGRWQPNTIYYRDFGYPDSHRRIFRMADSTHGIGNTSAETFAELLSGPIVDIYVGRERRHWRLHRNLLLYHSESFQNEIHKQRPTDNDGGSNMPEDSSGNGFSTKASEEIYKLDLTDEDPIGFELLVKWLYQGKLGDISDFPNPQEKYDFAVACHRLHLLCSRFNMPQLKNIAMDQYRRGLNEAGLVPDGEELSQIYRLSDADSPFRTLMIRIAARQIMDPDSDKDAESYRQCFADRPDFAVDLVNAIKEGTGGLLLEDPTSGQSCEYHDHDEDPNCNTRRKDPLSLHNWTKSDPLSPELSPAPSPTPRPRKKSPSKRPVNGISNGVETKSTATNPVKAELKSRPTKENETMPNGKLPHGKREWLFELPLVTTPKKAPSVPPSTPGSNSSRRQPPKLAIRTR